MDPWILLVIFTMILLAAIAGGLWIAVTLGVVGVLALYLGSGSPVSSIGIVGWNLWDSFILTAVPLFLLMGEVLSRTGVAQPLYGALSLWVEKLPGGLLQTNVLGSAIFAAITGASTSSAAAFGSLSYKELSKRGYDTKFILGAIAGPAMLGILIPPSIPLIIYGAFTQQSVGRLFMAGVIPGIVFALIMAIYIGVRAKLQPHLVPQVAAVVSWKQRIASLKDISPFGALIFLVLGGMYLGWFTPTEAAAIGAAGALLLSLAFRRLGWKPLRESLVASARTSCLCFLIVLGAQILSFGLAANEIPRTIAQSLASLPVPPVVIMALLYVIYLFLGCFVDGLSMTLLTLPIIYPLVLELGYDPIWFGIVLTICIELGLLTPPMGLNLFVVQGATGEGLGKIVAGSLPYVYLGIIMLALVTAFPGIALWLPSLMRGG